MEYPFLLDKGSTDLFRFIVDSGDSDKVSESLKAMVKDRQSLEKQITECQSNITLLDNQIEDLKNKTKDSDFILDTCNKIIDLQSRVNKVRTLETIKENINSCHVKETTLYDNLLAIKDILNPLTESLLCIINEYKIYVQALKYKISITKINTKINDLNLELNKLNDLPKFEITTIKYNNLIDTYNRLVKLEEAIKLKSSFNLPEFNWTESKYDLNTLLNIRDLLLNKYGLKIATLTSTISVINEEMDDINKVLKHIEICPLCGNKMNYKEVKL